MTAQDVLDEARPLLNDTGMIRWSNANLLQYLLDTLDELWTMRRSSFYTAGIVITQPTQPSTVGDTVFVQDSYRLAMAHNVCYLAFLEDTDDAGNDKKALTHRQLFEKAVA